MVAPFFWLPLGFAAGLAAAWLTRRVSGEDAEQAGESPARDAEGRARMAPRQSLPVRLHKLNDVFGPIAINGSHPGELDLIAEYSEAVVLLADPEVPISVVTDYALGNSWTLSCAALSALVRRDDGASAANRIADRFDLFSTWQIELALRLLATVDSPPPLGAPLAGCKDWWLDNPSVTGIFADYFAARHAKEKDPRIGPTVLALPAEGRERVKNFLARVRHAAAGTLITEMGGSPPSPPSTTASSPPPPGFLNSIGRFWSDERDAVQLHLPPDWEEDLDAAAQVFKRTPLRSLLVSGDPMAGKTSFLRLLAQRLGREGWRVFEASGADLQAGQQYIGQLEGRIRQLVDELAVGNKLIWYVPDLLQLALSGTHLGQSASMLDQILPAVTEGRLLVWAEATPASTARLIQLRPKLRRVLEVIRLERLEEEASVALAKEVVSGLAAKSLTPMDASLATAAVESAQHYLNATALPGSALALIRLTVLRNEQHKGKRLTGHDVLETLSQLTGLPLSILDGSERIDLKKIQEFFAARVIGQSEAVASIVERIAMLKSGLNDPAKPIGVFLFAGPTGTGKTELAKTTAEYLFGSVDRMIRLDMSEYQTADTVQKILGGPSLPPDADTLIAKVRKQPFSLLLLDEFEKSSPQIWDLFLQVFDEGRLTDTYGHTADFRHCLIILTTNLGATQHQSSSLGFWSGQATFTNEQVLRTIGQTFRPEFQNRLDKVIVFKPLTRELMRGILKKELDRVFDRRGLKDRAWAVEWEASALEFLLEKGFSPAMGARPLKRAVDQYVIAPLAASIVERRFPEGDQFVFVRSDGKAIQADFVDPDGDGEPVRATDPGGSPVIEAQATAPTLATMILAPAGSRVEVDELTLAQEAVAERLASPEWEKAKAALAEEINEPEFWTRAERFAVLSRLSRMDRIEAAADTAASLRQRLGRRRGAPGQGSRELVSRLAMQLHLIREGLQDAAEDAPVDAVLAVEAAFDTGAGDGAGAEAWLGEVLDMYGAWAQKRNMQLEHVERVPGFLRPVLVAAGFGAHRTLAREAGLHVLEQSENAGTPGRLAARVLVTTLPPGDVPKARLRGALAESLAKAPRSIAVIRRYRRLPSPLVRNGDGSWRSGKLDAVLRGDFDIMGHEPV